MHLNRRQTATGAPSGDRQRAHPRRVCLCARTKTGRSSCQIKDDWDILLVENSRESTIILCGSLPTMRGAMTRPQNRPPESAEPLQESYVGQRVRHLRIESGWSIRALAEASGLSANTLSLIENGKISPSIGALHRAAQALGVTIAAARRRRRRASKSSARQPPHAPANASSTAPSKTSPWALPAAPCTPVW